MKRRTETNRLRDRRAIERIADMLDERGRFAEAQYRDDRSHGRLGDAALALRTHTRLVQLAASVREGLFDRLDVDAATEAFVDVADAERDDYVNGHEADEDGAL